MANPRSTGLLLLLVGVLVLLGNTLDVLPPAAFWAGLATYPIGGYLFFVGSRKAIHRAELRTARALNPRLANQAGDDFARQQGEKVVNPNAGHARAAAASQTDTAQVRADELMLYEVDAAGDQGRTATGSFAVTSDVSFPLELQEEGSLADQIERLDRLQRDGIISAEEMARAKAKLLG